MLRILGRFQLENMSHTALSMFGSKLVSEELFKSE